MRNVRHREGVARYLAPYAVGCVLVLSGSIAVLWLPAGLTVALALGLLLRVCWLEENIRGDLIGAQQLPAAYRRTQVLQAKWQIFFFGSAAEPEQCPRRLASIMRVQAHAHYTLFLGGMAAFAAIAVSVPFFAVLMSGGVLALAFARVDRLVAAERVLAQGKALSDEMLEDRGPLSRFVLNQ